MNDPTYVVETRDLKKSYPSPGGRLEVLRGIDMQLSRGELLAIMGLSGVGKSTLLNILGLLDSSTSGEVIFNVDGKPVSTQRASEERRARLRNEFIGFVFQFFHLLPDLDVLENTLLPAMISRSRRRYRKERPELERQARAMLDRVGLGPRIYHRPTELSGGERQRCSIARALMNKPGLLLCDEPTGNLDTETSELIHELFTELNRDLNTSILIVTHDPRLAARADRTLEMVDGSFSVPVSIEPAESDRTEEPYELSDSPRNSLSDNDTTGRTPAGAIAPAGEPDELLDPEN